MEDFYNLKNAQRDPNIIEFLPWKSIHESIESPMVSAWGPKDIPDSNLSAGFTFITEPVSIGGDSHSHTFDQYVFLIGGDPRNFTEFDADIEFALGGEVKKINYPCYVFIPKGTPHCPIDIKRVGKPFIYIDARLTKEASVRKE